MRGKRAPKRKIMPDRVYNSVLVQKLINKVMKDGKKSLAEKIVYLALDEVKGRLKKEPLEILEKAIDNVGPKVELRSRRVGGANYQVPIPVSKERKEALAIRWIIEAARNRKGTGMSKSLVTEIIDAYNNSGEAVQRRQTVHKMAEANKAFAIFRW